MRPITNFLRKFQSHHFLVLAGALVILPFLLISAYNMPIAGDDFNIGNVALKMGFWPAQKYWYLTWTGRYFSTFICSAASLSIGNFHLYKAIPLFIIAFTGLSVRLLINVLFPAGTKLQKTGLSFLLLAVFLLQLPSTPEGIYWSVCSLTYQLPAAFTLLFFWATIKMYQTNKYSYFVLACFFSFVIVGSSEINMVILVWTLAGIIMLMIITRIRPDQKLLLLFGLTLVFCFVVFKAPGNSLRETSFPDKHQFGFSIKYTVITIITYMSKWLPLFCLSAFFLLDTLNKVPDISSKIFGIHPGISFFIFVTFPFVSVFPAIWAIGKTFPPERILNTAYFFSMVSFFYFICTLFYYLKKIDVSYVTVSVAVRLFICFLFLLYIYIPNNAYHPNKMRVAYMDMLSNRAGGYSAQVNERFKLLRECTNDTCVVPPLKNIPSTLFPTSYNNDITAYPADWRNSSLAVFFRKKAVIVSGH